MSEANPQQPILVYPQYATQPEDEINLFELWQNLVARKNLIFIITAFFTITSIVAVLLWPKTWQAEIRFTPPQLNDMQGLNIQALNKQDVNEAQKAYTPDSIYNDFLSNYQSISQKRKFFNQNNVQAFYQNKLTESKEGYARETEETFKEFNKLLKLNRPKKQSKIFLVTSTLDFPEQKASSKLLNQYAQMIQKDTLDNLLRGVISQLQQKQSNIKDQISIKKNMATQVRENRILVLNESIKTAKSLNFKTAELQFIAGTGQNFPLYLLGYKSLEAEKKTLEERKDDTPFISGLTELEYQYILYAEQIKRLLDEKGKMSVARIDQEARVPEYPTKPKRKLIVIASTLLGFIFSLFIIFILNIKQK